MLVLAGDIGGTNARLAVFEIEGGKFSEQAVGTYRSVRYTSLEEIVRSFMTKHKFDPRAACFGVPGPVREGRARITNLPWTVEAARLAASAGIERVGLINDLEAQAWGIGTLGPDDFVVLNEGDPDAVGNRALIAAGTGLGQAGLYWDGEEHRPFASEGGHASFAPRDELEIALFHFLSRRFRGHVSWERVVSGPGFVNIHDFLIDYRHAEASEEHKDTLRKTDPAEITESAFAGDCPLCVEALDLFVRFYGAEAGNLALKLMATGGVYLGGGIAPRIIDKLRRGAFIDAFLDKGRMRPLLSAMPVRVVMREDTALLGAARYAARLAAA
jgi:glucokinase